jgi:predicted nucleic acid-binding protein
LGKRQDPSEAAYISIVPVVDASVALKWFAEEPDSSLAVGLRDAHLHEESPLASPDLLVYEVANVLLHNPRFTENEVGRAIHTLYDLQLELVVPTVALIHAAIRLAARHKLTFYDALYVVVAQELGMELITADHQLHRRLAHLSFVRLLQ